MIRVKYDCNLCIRYDCAFCEYKATDSLKNHEKNMHAKLRSTFPLDKRLKLFCILCAISTCYIQIGYLLLNKDGIYFEN